MKKLIKILSIITMITFSVLPLKTNAQDLDWSKNLDITTSTSSSIAKVEDGVIVLQYDSSSDSRTYLIKYDFDGKKIWEKQNTYGYNIESVSDGFIVWNKTQINKFDKDGNIIWSNTVEYINELQYEQESSGGLGNKLIEFEDGYVIGQSLYYDGPRCDLFKIDLNGNVVQRKPIYSLFKTIVAIGKSLDGKIMVISRFDDGSAENSLRVSFYDPSNLYYLNSIRLNMYEEEYTIAPLLEEERHKFNSIIETENEYILSGLVTVTFSKEGNINNVHDKTIIDMTQIDDNIYGYVIEKDSNTANNKYTYNVAVVKYDQNLKEISRVDIPFSFNTYYPFESEDSSVGYISQIQNRVIFYKEKDDDNINFMVLNTPLSTVCEAFSNKSTYTTTHGINVYLTEKYQLANYRVKKQETPPDTDEDQKKDPFIGSSGIISNIIKNPQTNSIIIIVVVVAIVLIVSVLSYIIYKKKNKKN